MQSKFSVTAQSAWINASRTHKFTGAAVDALAVTLHGWQSSMFHNKKAIRALGRRTGKVVHTLTTQRTTANNKVRFFWRNPSNGQELANGRTIAYYIIDRGLSIGHRGHRFNKWQARMAHTAKAPDIVQTNNAHVVRILNAHHGLSHELVKTVRIRSRNVRNLHTIIFNGRTFRQGHDELACLHHATVQLHAKAQVVHVRAEHRLGPRHTGVRIESINNKGVTLAAQGLGVHAKLLQRHAQFVTLKARCQKVHRLHSLGGLLRGLWIDFWVEIVRCGDENASLGDISDDTRNGSKKVALGRRRVLGKKHARIHFGLLFNASHKGKTFAIQAHTTRRRRFHKACRLAINEMKTRIIQNLKALFHNVTLLGMALLALIFLEWALASFFVTTHALCVECAHAIGDQISKLLPAVADHAISTGGRNFSLAGFSEQCACIGEVVAILATVHALIKHILVTVGTTSVHGVLNVWHVSISRSVFLTETTFMAVSAVCWHWLDIFVMVTRCAIQAIIIRMRSMIPRRSHKFAVVTGHTGRRVRDGLGVIGDERFIKFNTVARAAILHIVAGCRVFVVATFARSIVFLRVFNVVKNHNATSIIKANSVGS